MSQLAHHARQILDTALAASGEDRELMLMVGRAGEVRVLEAGGWSWEGLRSEHAAEAAYRVRRVGGRVRVEGMRNGERCLLESREPGRQQEAVRRLPLDRPQYLVDAPLLVSGASSCFSMAVR